MKKWIYLFALAVLSSIVACTPWELDRREIINYDAFFQGEENKVGSNPQNDILQRTNSTYLAVGTSSTGEILTMTISEEGQKIGTKVDYGAGVARAIIPAVGEREAYVMTGSTGKDLFVLRVDEFASFTSIDTFRSRINSIVGLVDEVRGNDIVKTSDGQYVVTGAIKQFIGNKRLLFLKVNTEGELSLFRQFSENAEGHALIEDVQGNFVIAGYLNDRLTVSKITAEGALAWQKKIPDTQLDSLTTITLNAVGNYLITGTKDNPESSYIVEMDTLGNVVWEQTYSFGGIGYRGYQLSRVGKDNYLFGAMNDNTLVLSRLDALGNILWSESYPKIRNELLNAFFQVEDCGLISFGIRREGEENTFRLIKTDADGQIR